MDRAVIKNQALRALYKAADSFTSRDPIKVPGIKGEPSSANLHPRAAGDTCDETKMAADCCNTPRRNVGRKVKRAADPGAQLPGNMQSGEIPSEVLSGAANGAAIGSMALPGLAGAGLGASYGLLNPGRDAEGRRKSRLLAALKYGLMGGVGGAAAGPLGAAGALGGGALGAAHGLNKLSDARVGTAAQPSLAVKLAMLTATPIKQALPIGQGASQRQKDQAQAVLKQNGRIV